MNKKQLVSLMAMFLIEKNGKTTTKEVKDAIHQLNYDPAFDLRQKEVHDLMAELYHETGLWSRDMYHDTSVSYYIYSNIAPADNQTIDLDDNLDASNSNTGVINNSELVGYIAGSPDKNLSTGSTKKDTRRLTFQEYNPITPGLDYDNVRICTLEYFQKKYPNVTINQKQLA